jgi:predicted MFS family arabinose efflux permease
MVLAAAAVLGAGAVLALPPQDPPRHAALVPSPAQTLSLIWRHGPLRRTLGLTVTVAFSVAALPIYAVAIAPALGGGPAAGLLVAAYGAGNLLASAGLMLRPLRGDADRLMSLLAVLVAATLTAVIFTPTLPASLTAFCLAGVANAMFFAATLAARSEFAPAASRGQIFIWVGALKIAAGAAGTATAGALVSGTPWTPLVLSTALTALTITVSAIDRNHPRKCHQ